MMKGQLTKSVSIPKKKVSLTNFFFAKKSKIIIIIIKNERKNIQFSKCTS